MFIFYLNRQSLEEQFHPDCFLFSSSLRQRPEFPCSVVGVVRHEGEGHLCVNELLHALQGTLVLQVRLPHRVRVDAGPPQYGHHHLHGRPVAHWPRVDQVGGAEHGQHGAAHHLLELLDTQFPLAEGLTVGEEGDGAGIWSRTLELLCFWSPLILILQVQPGATQHLLLEPPGVELLAVAGPVQPPLGNCDEVVGAR